LRSASYIHHNCLLFRGWCSNLDGSAGFTTQVFDYLKAKVNQGEEIIVSLVVDEMDIRKHSSFDGNKFVENVDLGDNRETGDDDEVASEALVFLVVALNNSWKLPVETDIV